MSPMWILLMCPALAFAGISVELVASADESVSDVRVSGSDIDIISEKERQTFKLSDYQLKSAVDSYYGKRPDDAYLCSPTPWGDLYKTYGWEQVTRTLRPSQGKVLGLHTKPTIVLTQRFHNNSTRPATFNVGISQTVQNTISNTWSSSHEFTVGQDINYEVTIEAAKVGGSTKFQYKGGFGQSDTHTESVTIGSTTSMSVLLQPGQSVTAELSANLGSMKVQVDYLASLKGHSAVNYSKPYKGHHFWALPIRGVMNAGGISNSLETTQILDIGFYSDSKVVVRDDFSHAIVAEVDY